MNMNESPDYFLDMYGTCDLGRKCHELKPGVEWLGRACPHWKPLGVRSHAEFADYFRKAIDADLAKRNNHD
jgi:hypothetical protein